MYPSWTFYSTLFRTRANQPKELEYNFTVYSTQVFTPLLVLGCNITLTSHLTGVDRSGDKGGLREELGGSQQITDPIVVPLVLLHRLYMHLLFGQQCFITRRVTGRWQELEISMATA